MELVTFPDGSKYQPTRAWHDLFKAIVNAQKFIYITGWSVFTDIQLVRGEDDQEGLSTVGNLLKHKAENGVRVLMMVWDAHDMGVMGTNDEVTKEFFEGSNVECILVPRQKEGGGLESTFVGACYSHHQKTVICDADAENTDLRRIIAFIGGLDITGGRYDTLEFPLFKTINTVHKGDFYSNCVVGATAETGPMDPWYHFHARV